MNPQVASTFQKYLQSKQLKIPDATRIYDQEKLIGLAYPNKYARRGDHTDLKLNGRVGKNGSIREEARYVLELPINIKKLFFSQYLNLELRNRLFLN